MLIFTRIAFAYYCFNSGMKAFSYLTFPNDMSPIAPFLFALFALIGLSALFFTFKLNPNNRTDSSNLFRFAAKTFGSIVGVQASLKSLLAVNYFLQGQQYNEQIMIILAVSLFGHVATVLACYFLIFKYFLPKQTAATE